MDDRHSDHALIGDALAREIEDALDVEPSPHFAARVLANTPARRSWAFSWTFAVAVSAAAAAIVTAVLVMPGRNPRTPTPVAAPMIAALPPVSAPAPIVSSAPREVTRAASAETRKPGAPAAASATRPESAVPVVARVQPNEPEVLFAGDETAALQRLTRGITRGAVDPATLAAPSTTIITAIQPGAIVLAPLTEMSPVAIEPFGSLAEGVRQ